MGLKASYIRTPDILYPLRARHWHFEDYACNVVDFHVLDSAGLSLGYREIYIYMYVSIQSLFIYEYKFAYTCVSLYIYINRCISM